MNGSCNILLYIFHTLSNIEIDIFWNWMAQKFFLFLFLVIGKHTEDSWIADDDGVNFFVFEFD